jgi:hypothetical protein
MLERKFRPLSEWPLLPFWLVTGKVFHLFAYVIGYGDKGWPEDVLKGPMPVAFRCLKRFPVWTGTEETYCEVLTEVTLIVAGVRSILNSINVPTFFNFFHYLFSNQLWSKPNESTLDME